MSTGRRRQRFIRLVELRQQVSEMKLSEDGLYYWDGRQWISTLSPDGRSRWNGIAWVPVAPIAAPAYAYYPQPATIRVPTPWTKPMQYAVAAWYALSALYAASLPFWMSGVMTQAVNQSFQRQAQLNPNVAPPPPEFLSSMTSMMSGILWASVVIGIGICAVLVIGALRRWTWIFWVVLVLLGLGTLFLPFNLISAVAGSTYAERLYGLPSWTTWLSVAIGIPTAALFIWMLVALIRYGPWATRKVTPGATTSPAPAS
jgi:hypothetical protein